MQLKGERMSQLHGSGTSEAGHKYQENEDCFVASDKLGLYAVCDGAGGPEAGEFASKIAVGAICEYVDEHVANRHSPISDTLVAGAVRHAFLKIYNQEKEKPEWTGMNTTLTMFLTNHNRAVVGHVGDSRLYLARNGKLALMTIDHELTSHLPHKIDELEIDTFSLPLRHDDVLLLCTDGMNPIMNNTEWVLGLLRAEKNVSKIAKVLLEEEIKLSNETDATVVVVRVTEDDNRVRLKHYINKHTNLYRQLAFSM